LPVYYACATKSSFETRMHSQSAYICQVNFFDRFYIALGGRKVQEGEGLGREMGWERKWVEEGEGLGEGFAEGDELA